MDRGDFIRFCFGFQLPEHESIFRSPRAHHVNGRFSMTTIMRAPECFTINRNHLPLGFNSDCLNPTGKTGLKLIG